MSCTACDTAAKATKVKGYMLQGATFQTETDERKREGKKEEKNTQMQDFNPERWAIKWKYK